MKKHIYTIAFIALFSAMASAQTSNKVEKKEPAKAEKVNDDGTVSPAPASPAAQPAPVAEPAATDNAPNPSVGEEKPKSATRMAITEKGVPASKKPAEQQKAEPAKAEKH